MLIKSTQLKRQMKHLAFVNGICYKLHSSCSVVYGKKKRNITGFILLGISKWATSEIEKLTEKIQAKSRKYVATIGSLNALSSRWEFDNEDLVQLLNPCQWKLFKYSLQWNLKKYNIIVFINIKLESELPYVKSLYDTRPF